MSILYLILTALVNQTTSTGLNPDLTLVALILGMLASVGAILGLFWFIYKLIKDYIDREIKKKTRVLATMVETMVRQDMKETKDKTQKGRLETLLKMLKDDDKNG